VEAPRDLTLRIGVLRRWNWTGAFVNEVLDKLGFQVVEMNDRTFDPGPIDVAWFEGNINWFPRTRKILTRLPRRPRVVVWHSEPLPLPSGSRFPAHRLTLPEMVKIALRDERTTDPYSNARRIIEMHRAGIIDLCVVSARSRQEYLAEKGIDAHFVPLGYQPISGNDLHLERDIDVLFIGALERRQKSAIRFLRQSGIDVEALGNWKREDTWGDRRSRLINRAKIFLNVQRFPGQFSGYRLILGMCNGAMVISEPMYDPSPYQPGTHFVSVDLEKMPDTIRHYLRDDSARKRIACEGNRFVMNDLTMEQSIKRVAALMMEIIPERRSQ
jgi:hypothetical protein